MTYPISPKSVKTAIIWHCDNAKSCDGDTNTVQRQIQPVIETLHSKGYRTAAFEHDYQILEKVTTQQPDILIVHLQTAQNNSYALCQTLRAQSATQHLPIIFIGTRADEAGRVEVLRCGGNAYLQMPISVEECWLSLRQHLETARLVRRLQADRISLSQKVGEYSQILGQQERLKLSLIQENEVLQKLAFVDGLTQVANRSGFSRNMTQRWQEAYKNQQPLSLLLCDIDYFKYYNDTYGHVEGDRCLRMVADALVRGTRENTSQVARYGGEEFAIVLPNTSSRAAQQIAQSVQAEIELARIPHSSSLVKDSVSVSIGVFTLVPDSLQQSYEDLIHGADEALYAAKLRGRDRAIAKPPVSHFCMEAATLTGLAKEANRGGAEASKAFSNISTLLVTATDSSHQPR